MIFRIVEVTKSAAKLGTIQMSTADLLINAAVIVLRSTAVCNEIAPLTRR
jgi:hypothetical protein